MRATGTQMSSPQYARFEPGRSIPTAAPTTERASQSAAILVGSSDQSAVVARGLSKLECIGGIIGRGKRVFKFTSEIRSRVRGPIPVGRWRTLA